ncbi:MAG: hypothetical protein LC749_01290 [Actinobacteria bacterium]|nr:hypothetical protein [Actinomycetota bacterium]
MKPNRKFQKQPKAFWALVKLVSEGLGYSQGRTRTIKRYGKAEVDAFLTDRGLDPSAVEKLGWDFMLSEYSVYRADTLENVVRPALMDAGAARAEFEQLFKSRSAWAAHLPKNKQRGDKAHVNYLGAMVNMLVEQAIGADAFNSNPRGLTTVTRGGLPVRTLARRMDGAYPSINAPKAVWEVKEYYGTTTFGSRVADGVYETMLDGTELVELRKTEGINVAHYLIVDDHFTWWDCGRSYLCRILDMLHDDIIDEVFFGRQVLTEWPAVVASWAALPAR